jgi:hypothetical protein
MTEIKMRVTTNQGILSGISALQNVNACFTNCIKLQRNQVELQWLHILSQINTNNLSNVRYEVNRTWGRGEKREYLEGKTNEFETNNKMQEWFPTWN